MCLGVHLFLYVDIQLWQPRSLKGAYLGKHGWLKPIALIYFLSDFLNIPFLSLCLWYLCMISLPYPVPSPVRVPFIFINHLSFAYTFLLQPQFCSVLSLIFVWMSFLLLLLKGWFFHKLCPFIFFFLKHFKLFSLSEEYSMCILRPLVTVRCPPLYVLRQVCHLTLWSPILSDWLASKCQELNPGSHICMASLELSPLLSPHGLS